VKLSARWTQGGRAFELLWRSLGAEKRKAEGLQLDAAPPSPVRKEDRGEGIRHPSDAPRLPEKERDACLSIQQPFRPESGPLPPPRGEGSPREALPKKKTDPAVHEYSYDQRKQAGPSQPRVVSDRNPPLGCWTLPSIFYPMFCNPPREASYKHLTFCSKKLTVVAATVEK